MTLRVAGNRQELLAAELWAQGTLGLQSVDSGSHSLTTAYFERGRARREGWDVGSKLRRAGGAEVVSVEALEERDWLASYRRQSRPFALGRRFWVDPGEGDRPPGADASPPAPDGRIALALPARRAFGTGSHESTRLAVEMLEDLALEACTVLDVGAGSGVLSLAARALGAPRVVAVEVDSIAALLAAQNRASNGLDFSLLAGRSTSLRGSARFDLVLVNIIPEVIADELPGIVDRLEPRGRMVVSGFLTERSEAYRRRLEALGLSWLATRALGEWSAFLMGRSGRGGAS